MTPVVKFMALHVRYTRTSWNESTLSVKTEAVLEIAGCTLLRFFPECCSLRINMWFETSLWLIGHAVFSSHYTGLMPVASELLKAYTDENVFGFFFVCSSGLIPQLQNHTLLVGGRLSLHLTGFL